MSNVAEKATECVACGGPIVHPFGSPGDFCSRECFRAGRTFCKYCGEPLPPQKGGHFKKAFCSKRCGQRYYNHGARSPYLQEELRRAACKVCGKSITQSKNGGLKQFCSQRCCDIYHRTAGREYSLTDRWGSYAPETRKILLELENSGMIVTAKHLANAIDREYKLRHHTDTRLHNINYQCKTCGKEFIRRRWSNASKDYCSRKCDPTKMLKIAKNKGSILTWEEVDEIRHLYETEQWSQRALAKKFTVSTQSISLICQYKSWKPEHDIRHPGFKRMPKGAGENGANAKLTWERVDEIRSLYAAGDISQREIGRRYGISHNTIGRIVTYKTWKPEWDPRKSIIQTE